MYCILLCTLHFEFIGFATLSKQLLTNMAVMSLDNKECELHSV